jgi:uncharacterized repeat protein (TIGR03943 family)
MSRVAVSPPPLSDAQADQEPVRSWSIPRMLGVAVLASWAGLFWYLLLTGRWALYVSSRVQWVVPFGAFLLAAVTLGRAVTVRVNGPYQRLRMKTVWLAVLMVFPVLTVFVLPAASLGSFAAGRRTSLVQTGVSASAGDISSGAITLVDVAAAQTSREGAKALSTRAGDDATFVGFVTPIPGNPAGEFLLTRYYITCCIADAQTIEVHVVDAPVGKFQADDWVRVTGKLYPLGRTVLMDAAAPSGSVTGIPKPSHPYITA